MDLIKNIELKANEGCLESILSMVLILNNWSPLSKEISFSGGRETIKTQLKWLEKAMSINANDTALEGLIYYLYFQTKNGEQNYKKFNLINLFNPIHWIEKSAICGHSEAILMINRLLNIEHKAIKGQALLDYADNQYEKIKTAKIPFDERQIVKNYMNFVHLKSLAEIFYLLGGINYLRYCEFRLPLKFNTRYSRFDDHEDRRETEIRKTYPVEIMNSLPDTLPNLYSYFEKVYNWNK